MAVAHQLADKSGEVILRYFRKLPTVKNKLADNGFDPVTVADEAAERAIRHILKRAFPDHGVVGEEFGNSGGEARYRWILDPIDGTRAFIMGQPLWGTLIGLVDHDTPLLGVMNQPFTGERFWASGGTAQMRLGPSRAKRIATRKGLKLADAILTSTDPALFDRKPDRHAFDRLGEAVRMTRFGGDCYNYCLLASGHIDLVVETGLKAHDIAALIPIVEGAGGVITTWEGDSALNGGRIVAAGDPKLHQEALRILQG